MERTGVTPGTWISAPDLADIAIGAGPFVTVQMSIEAAIENASQHNQLRWRGMRDQLAAAGAPDKVLDEIGELIADAHHEGQTLIAVADSGGVQHASHWPEPPVRELARWAPLPSLAPVLEWRQALPPYVTVVTDRTGAEIHGVRPGRPDIELTADGPDGPIRKVQAGGWSHRRYQQRAETTWEESAKAVAEAVERMAARVDARAVFVAGEVRAATLLRDALSPTVQPLIHEVGGSRSADGAEPVDEADVGARLAEVVAGDTNVLLEKLTEELGQSDRAAAGVAQSVRALAMAQVEVLLIHDDPDVETTAWFGPEAVHLATKAADLEAMGVDDAQSARLADVLIRAALGTGAGVRVLPHAEGLHGGVGAILRWS
jgi:peptide subunit release factor 1 (eRF1)